MSTKKNGARERLFAPVPATENMHLVCSSGGSRAILGGAGAIVAIEQAGINNWESIGGISGGSIPAVMYAAGFGATKTLRTALDIDFSSKLTRHGSLLHILFAYFMQGRFERTRPRKGVLSSEKLGEYIDEMIPVWPKGYWTMGVVGKNQILFTDTGVYEITPEGEITTLSDKPGPLGIAVRATCAVPGIISAVQYKGRFLFDGALTPDGRCPVDIPKRHLGADEPNTIAVDVGDDGNKTSKRVVQIWKWLCGGNCIPEWEDKELTDKNGMIVIRPELTQFRSLQFTLTRDQKWQAVMAGYVAGVEALKKAGRLEGQKLVEAEEVVAAYRKIQEATSQAEEGVLTTLTEDLLSKYGLY